MADKKDTPKVDSQQTIDEAVVNFLKARQERILVRRGRIAEKLARKFDKQQDTGSNASSLEALGGDAQATAGSQSGAGRSVVDRKPSTAGGSKDDRKNSIPGGEFGHDGKRSTVDSLDVQIDESRKQLEQIILDGEALITNVRVASECREKLRHIKQSETRKERVDRLNQESDECQEMYDNLKPNWDIKGEKVLPLDLYAQIKKQQEACEELLTKKDDLIISLQREIEENDFEYETNLEKYQKDVSLIGDRIDDCVDDLQSAFLNELNLIEDYTCRNREVLLEENQREWMDLLDDFETMEEGHLKDRKQDALDKFKILNDMYITVKQECRAMRHRFEDDLRILVQELEQIKYATQLNMEKLQYNLAIIRKRYKENVEMKNMMKRLLLKFNERFTNKSRQLKAKVEAGRKEAKKILNDIAKLEESLEQFGRKTLHLAVSDYNKYMDLWIVSEEIVRERLQKLLDSEKFIFETQLGMEVPSPDLFYMDARPAAVTKYMEKKSTKYAELQEQPHKASKADRKQSKKESVFTDDLESEPEIGAKAKGEAENNEVACQPQPAASLLLQPSESIEFLPGPEPDPAIQRRLMKHVAKVICDESGFIVEDELRRLLEPLVETERNLVKLDALLKALGINTVSEMQYLAHFLLKRCRVTKGVISRIGSDYSAHLSEMNVSLDGILEKNALDDLESGSVSTKSKTPSPLLTMDDETFSTEFKECDCNLSPCGYEDEEDQVVEANDLDCEPEICAGAKGEAKNFEVACQAQLAASLLLRPSESLEFIPGPEPDPAIQRRLMKHVPKVICDESVLVVEEEDELRNLVNVDVLLKVGSDNSANVSEMNVSLDGILGKNALDDLEAGLVFTKSKPPSLLQTLIDETFSTEFKECDSNLSSCGKEDEGEDENNGVACQRQSAASLVLEPSEPIVGGFSNFQIVILSPCGREDEEGKVVEVKTKSAEQDLTEDKDETETESIMSMDSSSNGSDEFMYIEPHEVIEALTEFCKDYNAKITVELPTLDELIDKKLKSFKYPSHATIMEYWERPVRVLNVRSVEFWNTMQYCFEQYHKSLRERNDLVEQVTQLYSQNFELSHLMQKHVQSAKRFLPKPSENRPAFRTSNMKYC